MSHFSKMRRRERHTSEAWQEENTPSEKNTRDHITEHDTGRSIPSRSDDTGTVAWAEPSTFLGKEKSFANCGDVKRWPICTGCPFEEEAILRAHTSHGRSVDGDPT